MAQLGLAVFGNGPAFVFLQFATAAILVLAANTAYNGFPSLSSIIAKDGYLPRQLAHRGDRLVFSNGIIVLAAAAAAVLLVAFGGITNALIPLYAVGVFTSFTLSQFGMVRHHRRLRKPGWQRNVVLERGRGDRDAGGAAHRRGHEVHERRLGADRRDPARSCSVFKGIRSHYDDVAQGLRVPPDWKPPAAPSRRGDHGARRGRRGARGARVRTVDRARPPGRGDGRRRCRGRGARREAVAAAGRRRAARDRARTVGRLHRGHAALHRRARAALAEHHGDRGASPSSTWSTGGSTCSTTRARWCSRGGCCSAKNTAVTSIPYRFAEATEASEVS